MDSRTVDQGFSRNAAMATTAATLPMPSDAIARCAARTSSTIATSATIR
jgi:hypothetical protein